MKILKKLLPAVLFLFLLGLAAIPQAHAQLAIAIEMTQKSYLAYEPVYVRMVIENRSAVTLAFGSQEKLSGKVFFDIYPASSKQRRIQLTDDNAAPQIKDIIIPSGATREIIFKISSFYDITKPGNYFIRARVSHPLLPNAYASNETSFHITSGSTVWEALVGVPDFSETALERDPNKKIESRRYRLVTYNSGKNSIFVLLIENDEKIFLLKKLGFNMSASLAPHYAIDFLSRLHIIFAASPHVYVYYQFNINGEMINRSVFLKTDTTPKLLTDSKTGVVSVAGGREPVPRDYEEIAQLPFLRDYVQSLSPNLQAQKNEQDRRYEMENYDISSSLEEDDSNIIQNDLLEQNQDAAVLQQDLQDQADIQNSSSLPGNL